MTTTTATFMTEFRSSMTFQYKPPTNISPPDLVSRMTPQHHPHGQSAINNNYKSPDAVSEVEKSSDMQHSPGSSRGTSLASSPALPIESASINANGLSQDYSLRESNMDYPSSDDSVSMPNDMSGYNGDQDDMPSPLAQLQCALEKNGMIGKKLDIPAYPNGEGELMMRAGHEHMNHLDDAIYDGEMYKCHLCSFSINSKIHFNSHMNSHFDHKCPFCDYTSRTEGRLKRHVKDFHSETPPDSWAGTRVPGNDGSGGELSMDDSVSSAGNNKPRTYRCKQCGFVAYKKNDFWEHNKIHIKAEKLLTCPQCAFVTEYKHHLEYHIRNHFGSKPFKCGKCNYSCVNKSMLNSHMKSHSNIYQYRCSNCSYATKYCHSLKLHLRKYDHKPSSVLNVDGTPNPFPVIDVYGTRRGPRPKKRKFSELRENNSLLNAPPLALTQPNYNAIPPMMQSNLPVLYSPQFFNGYHGNVFVNGENYRNVHPQNNPHFGMKPPNMKCILCEFTTDRQDMFQKHMLMHAAKDNQDLIKLYGITSETILQMQEHQMAANNYLQNNRRDSGGYKFEVGNRETTVAQRSVEHKPQTMNGAYSSPVIEEVHDSSDVDIKMPCPPLPEKKPELSQRREKLLENGHDIEDNINHVSRSVIVTHKTMSPVPAARSENGDQDSKNVETKPAMDDTNNEHSPLDLSNAKSGDSRSPINQKDIEDGSCSSNEIVMDISSSNSASELSPPNSMFQSTSPQGQPRHRRKGKAFKIDRYLQAEEQTSPFAAEQNAKKSERYGAPQERNAPWSLSEKQIHLPNTVPATGLVPTCTNGEPSLELHHSPKSLVMSSTFTPSYLPIMEKPMEETVVTKPVEAIDDRNAKNNNQSFKTSGCTTERQIFSKSRQIDRISSRNSSPSIASVPPVPKSEHIDLDDSQDREKWSDAYMCIYCDMAFRDCVMYTMHMGYHGYGDPYTCNMCGCENKNKVEFFLHIARAAHT